MPMIAIPAHFDGEQIRLDEPYPLKPDTKLIVTVVSEPLSDAERESWLTLSSLRLEGAYGENEPDYSSELLKVE